LFDKAKRSFSHGCIRTQNPLDLAEVLLEGSSWDKQKIRETLDYSSKSWFSFIRIFTNEMHQS